MKIVFCSCLFLCLAAVYGQTIGPYEGPIGIHYDSIWSWLPLPVCVRSPGRRVRVSFDSLPPITENGLATYYDNCHLCRILGSGCRQIKRCPIRDECCKPDRLEHIVPTLHCVSARGYNCSENVWIEWSVNGPVHHPIVYNYMYLYVRSCSCKHCNEWIDEVGNFEADANIGLRDCDKYPEAKPNDYAVIQELPRCSDV